MTDLNQWERAVQMHVSGMKIMLQNILQQSYSVEVTSTETGSNEEADRQMGQAGRVIRFVEKHFQSEVFLGFSDNWMDALADQLLDNPANREQVDDMLLVELGTQLMNMLTGALAESGVEIEVANLDVIKKKNLARAFNMQHYFRASLQATPDETDGTQPAAPLDVWVAVSHPDKEAVDSYAKKFDGDNPFVGKRYENTLERFAGHVDMTRDRKRNGHYKAGISMEGQSVEFEDFSKTKGVKNTREVRNIDILKDVEMHLSVELGRREMPLGTILQLVKGSVIELEKLAGEPVEILVNGHKIAQGDVVVIDEHFGVRISNLLASQERIKELQ